MSTTDFQYFINSKKMVVIASFVGSVAPENQHLFQQCFEELKLHVDAKYVILNLQGLQGIAPDSYRPFTLFQSLIREDFKLLICSLDGALKKELSRLGLVRDNEIQDELISALQKILSMEKQ